MTDDIPAYRILTPRLVVRCWDPGDAAMLQDTLHASQQHLLPWMPWALHEDSQTVDDKLATLRRFRNKFDQDLEYVYGIFDRQEQQVLGGTGLHPRVGPGGLEIGYWIHKDYINQGLATEAAAAMTRVAFEIHGMQRTELHIDSENLRSAAVPPKLGYSLDGVLRQRLGRSDGTLGDEMIWSLLVGEYPSSPCAKVAVEAYDGAGRRIAMNDE